MAKKISGTKEWSIASVNCVTGCENDCRYCYARHDALTRYGGRIKSAAEWSDVKIREHDVKKGRKKIEGGMIMFPTTHDITSKTLEACLIVLEKLLKAGNEVLIVSKPRFDCIKAVCDKLFPYQKQILFRFTIGCVDNDILQYWDRNASNFEERLQSLMYAEMTGFRTSVSTEPMLDAPNVIDLFISLRPWVTDSIWIGKMNKIRDRVPCETEEDKVRIAAIEAGQADERIWEIYRALKDEPKVRWKESIKEIIGLDLAEKAGLDK